MLKYELIPHTADLGIRVTGKDLKDLFQKAGWALFDIMTDIKKIRPLEKETISVRADNLDELMNYWLTSLLQQFTLKNRLLSDFRMAHISDTSLEAIIQGEPFDPTRHEIIKEIKAITFHNLSVKQLANGWQAEVIFDV